jgi:hypothetical protein
VIADDNDLHAVFQGEGLWIKDLRSRWRARQNEERKDGEPNKTFRSKYVHVSDMAECAVNINAKAKNELLNH